MSRRGRIPAYNIEDLRRIAQRKLPRGVFEFIDRGAEDEISLHNNRRALQRIQLKPRVLVDVKRRSQEITLFGQKQPLPLVIAPTGAGSLLWFRGDVELARAAADAGIPFSLTAGSMIAIEEITSEAPGRNWLQIYLWEDRQHSYDLLDRAHAAGYEALILTVDTAVTPNREYMAHNGFSLPFRFNSRNVLDTILHPRWLASVIGRYAVTSGLPGFPNHPGARQGSVISGNRARLASSATSWDDLRRLRAHWDRTLIVKGILNPADALKAVECGADGIVVSNHGGRNLDGAPASIEVLGEIVDAVKHRTTILIDSGFRRGADVVKALAIGADAVMIGRATLYALAAAGRPGAARALSLLGAEIDRVLGLLGCTDVRELSREHLHVRPIEPSRVTA
jgi:isopentenyl diphosphate isomerase/L-lactate dehydrogenase-like FMN-dependent dehydrogenase